MLRKLLINAGSNFSVMTVQIVITFIMTPIYIARLGDYDYGLWIMIASVIGYMGVLDMGVRPAISRYAAKYTAENDIRSLHVLYSTAFLFLLLVGIVLSIVFIIWGLGFPGSIAPENSNIDKYAILLLVLGCRMLVNFPGFVAESYLEGFQEYALKNNIAIFNTVIASVCFVVFVDDNNGLTLIALITTVEISLKYVIYMYMLGRSAGRSIRFHLSDYSPEFLREILAFGVKSMVQGVATRIENSTDTLIIGLILGPSFVPFYSIPASLVGYVRTIGQTLTHVFMPLFSALNALNDEEQIRRVYLYASKYAVGLILPMLIGIMVIGGPFISIWIDPEYGNKADMIVVILSVFVAMYLIDPFRARYLTALGKHGIFAKLMPFSALMNFVLSIILIHTHGIVGVALGSLLTVFFFTPVYTIYTCRQLEIRPMYYLGHSVMPAIIPSAIMGVAILLYRVEYGITDYWHILQCVILGMIVYIPSFAIFGLTAEDRHYLARLYTRKS